MNTRFCGKIVAFAVVWFSAMVFLPFQAVSASQTPLSYFGVYYQNLLEFSTSGAWTLNGLVHCNTNIDVGAGTGAILTFNNTVSSAGTISAPTNNGSSWGNPTNYNSSWRTVFNGSPSNLVSVPPLSLSVVMTNLHDLIDVPLTNDASTDFGRARLYNKAQVILTISNKSPTDVYSSNIVIRVRIQKAPDITSVPGEDPFPIMLNFTNLSAAALSTNLPFLSLTNLFFDRRESKTNVTTQIDIGLYKQWLTNSAGPVVVKFPANGSDGYPTILFVNDVRNTTTAGGHKFDVVRIKNGQSPPVNGGWGFTVATPNPLYVWGNYNQTNSALLNTTNTSNGTVPCAFFSDALTVLSTNWTDAHTLATPFSTSSTLWDARSTTVNAAIVTGIVPSTGTTITTFSGGVHNLVRLLEDWTAQTLTLNTALINLYASTRATGQFLNPGSYYEPPTRQYNHDSNFQQITGTPPGMPLVSTDSPLIFTQSRSDAVPAGNSFELSVQAAGYGPLSYQWALNGTNIDGATNSSLSLTNVQDDQAGEYTVIVADGIDANTNVIEDLTVVDTQPVILQQPVDQSVMVGSNATLSVLATGTTPMNWQWQFNGTNIDDATNAMLMLTNVTTDQAGTYSVMVTNVIGSTASSNAVLDVSQPFEPSMRSFSLSTRRQMQFAVNGTTNVSYVVQASTDLVHWESIMTNVGPFHFSDTSTANLPQRFYRVISAP